MLQLVNGIWCFVTKFTTLSNRPFHDGGDPSLTRYAEALNTAVRNGAIDMPGTYAIVINAETDTEDIYFLQNV